MKWPASCANSTSTSPTSPQVANLRPTQAPLFYAHALVALPPQLELDDLVTALESLSDDLVVDIDQDLSE